MNVSFEMIDSDQGFVEGEGQRFGVSDSDQQGAGQPGSLRDGQRVDRLVGMPGIGQRLADHGHNRPQVLPRSQFRNHAAVRLVRRDLREDDIRDHSFARIHDRRRGLVAGAFNAENVGAGHDLQFKSRTSMDDGRPTRSARIVPDGRDARPPPRLLSAGLQGGYNMRDVERKPERATRR